MCACKGAGENAGLRLCTGGQSGAVACLCATKLQGKFHQQEMKPLYTNIYLYSKHIHVQFMYLNCSRCLSQKTVFFFPPLPLSLLPPSPPPPFIIHLSIAPHPAVCWLSVDGPQLGKHPLGGAGGGFDAAWQSVFDLLPWLRQAQGACLLPTIHPLNTIT